MKILAGHGKFVDAFCIMYIINIPNTVLRQRRGKPLQRVLLLDGLTLDAPNTRLYVLVFDKYERADQA